MSWKVCVIGHFGLNENLLNGQTIKTKIITQELERQLSPRNVLKIDTHNIKGKLIKVSTLVRKGMKNSENIIMMPAHNGIRFFSPLLFALNFIYPTKLHYIVIGGWLPQFLENRKLLSSILKKFDGIYVETNTMKRKLEQMGFKNVFVMPNCKELSILKKSEIEYDLPKPYRLCTFSRVMKEKGIEDAIKAVLDVNRIYGENIFSLDIYGQIDDNYKEDFFEMKKSFPNNIRYCGSVPFDKTTQILKKYYALLFPTQFYTEGIPGTIIDAYASGVPVIASRWESFSDLIEDNEVGYGYQFGDLNELEKILLQVIDNPIELNKMRIKCIDKAYLYNSSNVVGKFIRERL